MRNSTYFILPILAILVALIIPAAGYANSINLHDEPSDTSKITGTINLATGIIPIYTPPNSQWIKVGDPNNGNTGWVKSSELKDSKGNIITFSQRVSDNGSTNTQSMQMNIGNPPLSPQQQQALIDQQQKASEESIKKAQQSVGQALEAVKDAYQKQLEVMQSAGFPKGPMPVTGIPAQAMPTMPGSAASTPAAAPATQQ